jgi:hypothetical protein
MADLLFAIFHLVALLAVVVYAFISLAHSNIPRFLIIMALLVVYYILILHKAVIQEIRRKRKNKTDI